MKEGAANENNTANINRINLRKNLAWMLTMTSRRALYVSEALQDQLSSNMEDSALPYTEIDIRPIISRSCVHVYTRCVPRAACDGDVRYLLDEFV